MKKTLLSLLFAAATLLTCETSKRDVREEGVPTTEDDLLDSISFAPDSLSPKSEFNLLSVDFPIECADDEIGDLVGDATLGPWSKNYALGGTFKDLETFFPGRDRLDPEGGVLMWYTFDLSEAPGKIILALEPWRKSWQWRRGPKKDSLVYPDSVFTYTIPQPFSLANHSIKVSRAVNNIILKPEVKRRMEFLNNLIDVNHSPRYQRPFNKKNGGFFQNNPSADLLDPDRRGLLTRLVTQKNAKGIRYYFALKNDPEYDNMIRIILIATDANGKNITTIESIDSTGKKTVTPALVIQRSVPPGPSFIGCPG